MSTALTPKPPRPPQNSARSAASVSESNDLILSVRGKHRSGKKSSTADSESTKSIMQAEVDRLKKQLKESEKRLLTPVRTDRRKPRDSVQAAVIGLQGERYNAEPHEAVPQRVMWEPFSDDPEVKECEEALHRSEERLTRRKESWEHEWRRAQRDEAARIQPPNPPVFAARDDNDVLERAAKAEAFMASGRPAKFSTPPAAADKPRAYSPNAASRSTSRAQSRTSGLERKSSVRRTASLHPNHSEMFQGLQLNDALDLVLPDPEEVVDTREGDILSNRFILKRDLFDAAFSRTDSVGVMCGAPGFRMIPRFNIGAVSQAHVSGIRTVLNELCKQWEGPIVWINLREEPVVYVNNRSYVIRGTDRPLDPLATPGISAARLEELERKLRNEVLREGQRFGGNIIVHKEAGNGEIEALWEAVDEQSVVTIGDLFADVTKRGYDVRFHRLPVTPHTGVSVQQFDAVFDIAMKHRSDPIIVNCQTGRGRSTVGMLMAAIVRFFQHGLATPSGDSAPSLLRGKSGDGSSFRKLMKLAAILPDGRMHERRVALLAEFTGKASNLSDRIRAAFKTETTANGIALLSRYCHLVVFSAYCEARIVNKTVECTFSQWLATDAKEAAAVLNSFADPMARSDVHSERVATPAQDEAFDASSSMRGRRGDVLVGAAALVKAVRHNTGCTEPIKGVHSLRQPEARSPLFTCGLNTTKGRDDLIYNIRSQFGETTVNWIDVRAEPHVYINGTPYMLMDFQAVFDERLATMHVTATTIENIEQRLKLDVLNESQQRGGVSVIEVDHVDQSVKTIALSVADVKTPREYGEQFERVEYHRVPFPAGDAFEEADVHALIDVTAGLAAGSPAVIEDTTGGLRATVALNIVTIVRLATVRSLRTVQTEAQVRELLAVEADAVPLTTCPCYGGADELALLANQSHKKELLVASTMGQMLAAGTMLMATEAVVGVCGRGREWNLLDRLNMQASEATAAIGDERTAITYAALASARRYLFVFLTAAYVDHIAATSSTLRFEQWVVSKPEINTLILKMLEAPKSGLKFVEPENLYLETDTGSVARRRGNVLTSNFGLKADHFPGAIRKNMVPSVPGVPNYRKVPFVNVYGVGIPTKKGIANLLRVLGAQDGALEMYDPDEQEDPNIADTHPQRDFFHADTEAFDRARPAKGRVVWMNMREEPLLYVVDRPFVLRDLANPYVNVELTGITTEKIEWIEDALVDDCLEDAKKYNDQFLIHDEIKPGIMGGLWEPGTPETIQTLKRIYGDLAEQGARIQFYRLPVTDEQMPKVTDFDTMVQIMLPEMLANVDYSEGEPLSFVFNCQMGRGRTTTGMVICCMLAGLVEQEFYPRLRQEYNPLYPADASPYSNGHWPAIQELMRVLVDGREAKQRVDYILEACNKMQNLRQAIELFKTQLESPDATESQRARALHHGAHYLVRYMYLIVFNSYLHEAWDAESHTLRCTFEQYMAPRDDVRHIAHHCSVSVK